MKIYVRSGKPKRADTLTGGNTSQRGQGAPTGQGALRRLSPDPVHDATPEAPGPQEPHPLTERQPERRTVDAPPSAAREETLTRAVPPAVTAVAVLPPGARGRFHTPIMAPGRCRPWPGRCRPLRSSRDARGRSGASGPTRPRRRRAYAFRDQDTT